MFERAFGGSPDKKIKILFAINNLNLGGAEVLVTEQIKNLDKKKFSVYLANLYRSKEPNLIGQVDFLGREKFKQFNFSTKSILSLKKWLAIYRFLKKEKFAIIYSHLFESNLLFRTAAFILRVPVIISFEHSEYRDKRWWQIVLDKNLALITDKIIVATKAVAEFTAEQEGIKPEKFFIIPNPVSLPDKNKVDLPALRRELDLTEDDFIVLSLGRFSEEKGFDLFLRAARKIVDHTLKIKFLLIGYGPQENRLRQDIINYRLEKYCRLVVKPERAKEFLFLGDIFVLSSLREGQSIATGEALMAGLPVVAFAVGGIKDIIADGENGLLLPAGDIDGLAEKTLYLYNNKEYRLAMAAKAKASVSQYGVKQNIKIFEQIIEKIYNESGK